MDKPINEPSPPASSTEYSVSVDEASELFAGARTARSPRTIIRYCAQGHLDCIKTDTQQNEKYLITRESVDRRLREIQQVARSSRVETGPDTSSRAETRHDGTDDSAEPTPDLRRKVESLEAKVRDLKITNRAKDYFLDQLKAERASFLDQAISSPAALRQLTRKSTAGLCH